MSLFPLRLLSHLKPVAAADYFLQNRFLAWFAEHIIGILAIKRGRPDRHEDPLQKISAALLQNDIVIFYPEGTRGEPEKLAKFKSRIAHLASKHPDINIYPIYLYGAGKALPKGEALLVPFVVDVQVGEAIQFEGDRHAFIDNLERFYIFFLNLK